MGKSEKQINENAKGKKGNWDANGDMWKDVDTKTGQSTLRLRVKRKKKKRATTVKWGRRKWEKVVGNDSQHLRTRYFLFLQAAPVWIYYLFIFR